MSKLSFRARALDPSKPMPIYLADELPDLPEYSAINRAVPQMPSGMEKEEESEHHLQRAIVAGLLIPTPEVTSVDDEDFYNKVYPPDYKIPRQLIHMQPLGMDQDIPDYDMDSADELWVETQSRRLDLTALKFEQMMDKLEKSSGQTVVTLNEAKALLKQDDEVSIAVYDYWLNKRLTMQHPLILSVKTENRTGMAPNNPYLAFRRRTEKMQTRKNRKNDESSYEKMWKLKRDLSRAVTLLEMVKRREKAKRAYLLLTIEIFEKRYAARDFSGQLVADVVSSMARTARPACAPIHSNQYHSPLSSNLHHQSHAPSWSGQNSSHHHLYNSSSQYQTKGGATIRDADGNVIRKEKRQYRKRKHKLQKDKGLQSSSVGSSSQGMYGTGAGHHLSGSGVGHMEPMLSSDEDDFNGNVPGSESEDEGLYAFKRNRNCNYHKPITDNFGDWPWVSKEDNGKGDPKYRYTLTSIKHPRPRCIGFARRRVTRGGRIALDRCATSLDEFWQSVDYTIYDSERPTVTTTTTKSDEIVTDRIVEDRLTADPVVQLRGRVSSIRTSSASEGGGGGHASPLAYLRVNNNASSSEIVIKREDKPSSIGILSTTDANQGIKIKEEQLDDYERLIDNVNSDRNNKQSSSNSGISSVSNNNSLRNNLTPQQQQSRSTFTHEFIDYAVKSEFGGARSSTSQSQTSNSSLQQQTVRLIQTESHLLGPSVATSALTSATCSTLTHTQESRDSGISIKSESIQSGVGVDSASIQTHLDATQSDSIYDEFLDEIQRSWLHFRPKTPPLSPSPPPNDALLLMSDISTYEAECLDTLSKITSNPFNVELQALDHQLPDSIFADNDETIFTTTEPVVLDTLMVENTTNRTEKDSSKTELINTSSSESLNELSLGLNESADDNEKLLANILEECQMEDGKALNQTSNFWNGLLEDNNALPVTLDLEEAGRASTPKFDKSIGYCSDAISLYSRFLPDETDESKPDSSRKFAKTVPTCQTEVAKSHFKLMRTKTDQLMHLKLKANATNKTETTVEENVQVKNEPQDPESHETAVIPMEIDVKEEIVSSADATASHDYAASPSNDPSQVTVLKSIVRAGTPLQNQQLLAQTTTSVGVPGIRRQINGPQVLQNLLRSANTYITSPQQQLKTQPTKLVEDPAAMEAKIKFKAALKPTDTVLVTPLSTNHNTTGTTQVQQQQQPINIIHSNALPQQYAIIGSTNPQQTGQIATLATIPSAIIMDGKNTDPKLQQRVKLDNRILYATNIKNNRGQLLTQLNQKVVNIVPIGTHTKNNMISTSAGVTGQSQAISVVSASPLGITKSGHMIQRVTTINNSQNIRANNTDGSNGGNKVIGVVTPAVGVDATNVKIIQTNDNNSVSGIQSNR